MRKNVLLCSLLLIIVKVAFTQSLTVSQKQLNFGNTFENAPKNLNITVTNNTGKTVNVTGIKFYNIYGQPAFSANPSVFSLNDGAQQIVTVTFAPKHNVAHNTEMVILNNSNRGNVSVDLLGQGKYSMAYYSTTENKEEQALKDALKTTISQGYVSLGYDGINGARGRMFAVIDNKKVNGQGAPVSTVECIYTGRNYNNNGVGYNESSPTLMTDLLNQGGFNTEHSFPQSKFNDSEPMRSDIHQLFPTDNAANNSRSSFPFGVASQPLKDVNINNPSKLGSNNLYEPRDEQKGRTARAMMYFVVRYQDYTNFFAPQESILRNWSTTFQPNAIEKKRNDDIFGFQKNRNPFVDYPQFADRITSIAANSVAPQVKTIDLTEAAIAYGNVQVNANPYYIYTIVNNGNQPIDFSNFSLTDNHLSFEPGSGVNTTLPPGEALNVAIRLTANSPFVLNAALQFNTTANGNLNVNIPISANLQASGPIVQFMLDSGSQIEGNGGQTIYQATVTVNPAPAGNETVDVVLDGNGTTATQNVDFTFSPVTLQFSNMVTSQQVSVTVLGDSDVEPDETVKLHLQNISPGLGGFGANNTHTLTILNDDCAEPANAATNATINNIGAGQFDINWINGTGENRIVVVKQGAPLGLGETPVDGNDYTANSTFGTPGTALGTGFVVYKGTGNQLTLMGLQPNTQYFVGIFESSCTSPNYKTNAFATTSGSTTAPCSEPSTSATAVQFANVTNSSMDINWSNGNGSKRVVVVKAGAPIGVAETPADGISYTANSTFGLPQSQIGGGYVVYNGSESSVTITELAPGQTYHVAVFEYDCIPSNYKVSNPAVGSQVTSNTDVVIVKWDFPGNPDDAVADDGIDANLAKTISTVGATGSIGFNVAGATTGAATNSGWDNGVSTKYWLINISTKGYENLLLSSKQRSSNTGPKDFKIQWSLDNNIWTDLAGGNIAVANDFILGVVNDTPLPAACNDKDQLFIRWVLTSNTGVNNSPIAVGGTSRMDDLLVKGNAKPLPVQLMTFTGKAEGATAKLLWKTASEENNKGFYIQKSQDGIQFTDIGFVQGKGTVNLITTYEYTDTYLGKGSYYRLKQVDFNEKSSFSSIIYVKGADISDKFAVFPNPFRDNVHIAWGDLESTEQIVLTVFSSSGNIVGVYKGTGPQIDAEFNQKSSLMAAGVYIMKVETSKGKVLTSKFLKQ